MTACQAVVCSNAFTCNRSEQSVQVPVTCDEELEDIDCAFLLEQQDQDKAY